jgi:hypothetical protein
MADAKTSKAERLDSILLRGRVFSSNDQGITLETGNSLLTVSPKDVREMRKVQDDDSVKELLVAADAKIIFEAVVSPLEVAGILSKEVSVELTSGGTECSRCSTECSRCSTECSRCATITTGTECSRCTTECSRCTTECSRCVAQFDTSIGGGLSAFRRRLS